MKMILKMASWTGGGLDPYEDMDFDDFLEWVEALRQIQKEDEK